MKSYYLRILFIFSISLSSVVMLPTQPLLAQEVRPASATPDAVDCIDSFKAAHIAAAIASVLPIPIPGFKTAADMAEFGANLGLKGCEPRLTAPPDIVKPPQPNCELTLRIPLDATYNELNQIDEVMFGLLLERYHVPGDARADIVGMLDSEFQRFENETYGSYSNVYGIELPLELSDWSSGNWGDVGQPEIYHYNSDVSITLRHTGKRATDQTVTFRAGSHGMRWEADTLISAFDWIPTFLIPGSDSPAGQKAAKEGATEVSKQTVKKAAKEAAKKTRGQFVKEVAKELATNIAKKGGTKLATTSLKLRQPYFVSGSVNASTYDTQRLVIQDHTPPTLSGIEPVVTVEAFLPGGAASAGNISKILATITASDDCVLNPNIKYSTPSFWPLLLDEEGNPLPSATIEWSASDYGAATPDGGVNTTSQTQQIMVVDTLPPILLPPPPIIMESATSIEIPLGLPQVFDVADLRPTVTYTASNTTAGEQWPIFEPGIHYVDWRATDLSRNSSKTKQQLVNIKAPGTNIPAIAIDQVGADAIEVIADEPYTITVRGADGNDPADPIWFTVDDEPENGFFIAPLYPYFIDDYRITARYSPQIAADVGEDEAWRLAADPSALRDYVKALCAEDLRREDLPKDFISWRSGDEFMTVDDEGYTYVYDTAYRKCTPGGSTIAPTTSPRISVWDADGKYYGEQVRSDSGHPLRDVNFNTSSGTILLVQSDDSSTGNTIVHASAIDLTNVDAPIIEVESYALWKEINRIVINEAGDTRGPQYKNGTHAALDTNNDILYIIGTQNMRGMAALKIAPCDFKPEENPRGCVDLLGTPIYSQSIVKSTKTPEYAGFGVDAMRIENLRDVTVDSTGAVYVLSEHRIYKFAPATTDTFGKTTLGDYIGWMGRCDSGPNCNYVGQHSIGFSCTDETCALEGDAYGSSPGQFKTPAEIALDPNDILYVADSGNDRVQRFNSDGLFAGEARSQSSCEGCSGFVLGDFGSPGNIAVNSNHFYIRAGELVHVFEASVIHNIDDTSAWVEYQSDSNYVGPDSFTFRATDGFRTTDGELIESDPATVALNVSRNFRPPQAAAGLAISTTEDTPAGIMLNGYDLDGDLDTLTYQITVAPGYGTVDGEGANRLFTPEANFYGEDSFTFVVNDGREDSEPMVVPIEVASANDIPSVIIRTDPLEAGAGFPFSLDALIIDADFDDTHTLVVDWGDGSSESSGEIQSDGQLSGPVILADSTISSTVLGFHTYPSAGDVALTLCATDLAASKGCLTQTVTVQDKVDLAISRNGDTVVNADDRSLTYALSVENRAPSSSGLIASAIQLTETLALGASYQTVDANGPISCQHTATQLDCTIETLPVGESAQAILTINLANTVNVGDEISAESSVQSILPEAILENNELLVNLALLPSADFYVTSLEDGADLTIGDGRCEATDGCTLRAAIQEANALSGTQTIAMGYGVHQLNISDNGGLLRRANEPLTVTDDLVVLGLNADRTIVNANELSRVLQVNKASLTMSDLMLSGGYVNADNGGALLVLESDLVLDRVAIAGNRALSGGGLIVQFSTAQITASALTDNQALAGGTGGALYNQESDITIQNSTFGGNHAPKGGVLMYDGGSVSFENATLIGNSATEEGGGIAGSGGSITLDNTILADNHAPLGPTCLGSITSAGHNLLGALQDCTVLGETTTNLLVETSGWDGLVRTAANTYAYELTADSAAINAGNCKLSTDQRGVERPFGDGCDIGAMEFSMEVVPEEEPAEATFLPFVTR